MKRKKEYLTHKEVKKLYEEITKRYSKNKSIYKKKLESLRKKCNHDYEEISFTKEPNLLCFNCHKHL
jgi:predicted ribosome-associated RNA-binding protein Tma20